MPTDEVCDRRPEGSRVGRFRFRRAHRLLHRRDFDRVLRGGRRRSLPELVVVTTRPGQRGRLRESGDEPLRPGSRLGITVSRKAGSSVERNRFKRRVREWFRRQREALPEPVDIVVIARRPAIHLSFAELSRRLGELLRSSRSQPNGKHQENRPE
ncbi:ribonuclease P protein component [Myxococcota bacterium]|nr:ribonuclease P protein component [Myxococcota bacterium]